MMPPAPPTPPTPRGWLARLWAELYVGMVLVALAVVAGAVAVLLVQAMFSVSRWVVLGD